MKLELDVIEINYSTGDVGFRFVKSDNREHGIKYHRIVLPAGALEHLKQGFSYSFDDSPLEQYTFPQEVIDMLTILWQQEHVKIYILDRNAREQLEREQAERERINALAQEAQRQAEQKRLFDEAVEAAVKRLNG